MGRQELRNMAKREGLDQKALTRAIRTAQTKTREQTVHFYSIAVLSVLADKFGFDKQKLQSASRIIRERFEAVAADYASLQDFETVLKDEYGIIVED